jgi:hypothetical protein
MLSMGLLNSASSMTIPIPGLQHSYPPAEWSWRCYWDDQPRHSLWCPLSFIVALQQGDQQLGHMVGKSKKWTNCEERTKHKAHSFLSLSWDCRLAPTEPVMIKSSSLGGHLLVNPLLTHHVSILHCSSGSVSIHSSSILFAHPCCPCWWCAPSLLQASGHKFNRKRNRNSNRKKEKKT